MTSETDGSSTSRQRRLSLLSSVVLLGVLPWPNGRIAAFSLNDCCGSGATVVSTHEAVDRRLVPAAPQRQVFESDPQLAPRRAAGLSSVPIAFGDRLKVQFIETVGVKFGKDAANEDTVTTVFPRTDLSGDLTVGEDGSVAIVKLGRFAAQGRALAEVQADLEKAFAKIFGRPGDVTISIEERKPVYVLGDVRAPGVFKYVPGMVVLQILASAGGLSGVGALASPDISRQIENVRETERLQQKRELMTRLLINQARLAAQRRDEPSIVLPANIRTTMAQADPPGTTGSLIASAVATLTATQAQTTALRDLQERQVAIARDDVKAHGRRADQLRDLLIRKQQRLSDLKQLASRGSVPQYNVLTMEIDVSDSALRIEDEAIALAQAQRREAEAEDVRTRLVFDASAKLETEWTTTMQEIEDCSQAIRSMEAVVRITAEDAPSAARAATALAAMTVSISRRDKHGFSTIIGDDRTEIFPGDIVQIGISSSPEAARNRDSERSKRSAL